MPAAWTSGSKHTFTWGRVICSSFLFLALVKIADITTVSWSMVASTLSIVSFFQEEEPVLGSMIESVQAIRELMGYRVDVVLEQEGLDTRTPGITFQLNLAAY